MKDFFDTWKFKILVAVAVFLVGIMAYAGANGRLTAAPQELLGVILTPFQKAGAVVSGGVGAMWEKYASIDKVMEQNEQLTAENAELRQQMVDYDRIKAENEAYKALANIQEKNSNATYVSGFVIGRDPLDEFGAVLRDMILDDTIPAFDTAEKIAFTGTENYTISYDEDGTSICADDVYFADGQPLDTDNVNAWLTALTGLDLTDYVSYNVTNEELQTFGLDEPALTITLDYSSSDEDGTETDAGTLVLRLSQNPEELAAYGEALANEEDDLPDVTCYARVGESQIVYQITQSEFDALTAVSYDTLRQQKLFTADFDTVTSIDVTLEGETYTFTYIPPENEDDEDAEGTWSYNGEEFDVFISATPCAPCRRAASRTRNPPGRRKSR